MYSKKLQNQNNDFNGSEDEQLNQQAQLAGQSWWGTAANWMKKKYFNGAHLLELALNDQKSNTVSLFGMTFKSNEEARILYSSILWFTYRENLKFYKINKEFTIKSDVGWGCMIRVGQMMLAHCLRLALGFQYFDDETQIKKILDDFIPQDGKYSVQKISQKAYELFGLKPGQWYNPNHISQVLCDLQNQNKKSRLKAMVFDNQFQLSKVLQFLDQNRKKNQKIISNKNDSIDVNSIKINPGLIIILLRIGVKTPQPQLLQLVIKFLRQERACIGILGGRPGKAHYMFGTTQKSFIYLDPHCVKQTNEIDSFFCNNMFSIPHQNIDPSMGLCFLVKNTAQLLNLYDKFDSQKKKLPFYSYSKTEIPTIIQKQQIQQEFQELTFSDVK